LASDNVLVPYVLLTPRGETVENSLRFAVVAHKQMTAKSIWIGQQIRVPAKADTKGKAVLHMIVVTDIVAHLKHKSERIRQWMRD
jgi:hypothetical protein